jgi:small-conductance mechanosensitive channel
MLFVALVFLLNWLQAKANHKIQVWRRLKKEGLAAKADQIVSADRIASRLSTGLTLVKWILIAITFIRYVSFVLELFKETESAGHWIVDVVLAPFKRIFDDFIGYIPNVFNLFAIIVVARYLLTLFHRVFRELGAGRMSIAGFYPEWAEPTYKLVRFFVLALALVAIYPYLPGAQSPAFEKITVFLGILISLGSSSLVSNVVSGTILTYMRALQPGDRVKIGEAFGDVIEKTMLVTRVRTIKNEVVTIPNSLLLNSQIVNYSTLAASEGLILHVSITIGYDVPWPQVHKALLDAARRTPLVLADPAPFILQRALNDFNVAYELNAYTREANRGVFILSDLTQNIQDSFDEAGLEILSPMYNTIRQSAAGDTIQKISPA